MKRGLTTNTEAETELAEEEEEPIFKFKFSVKRDQLEQILASQRSMQNYEDALWGFERTLNQEINFNRQNLIEQMQEIQQKHAQKEDTYGHKEALDSLSMAVKEREEKIVDLRKKIEDIETQNNNIMRQDKHKRALVHQGKQLLKFCVLSQDQQEVIGDAELYEEGD